MKRPVNEYPVLWRRLASVAVPVGGLCLVIALLAVLTVNGFAQISNTDSRGRRWSSIIEPPPPPANWDQLRTQQLSMAERLREAGISIEYKTTGTPNAGGLAELMPEGMQMSISLVDGDRMKLELGTLMPKVPGALEAALAKVSLEFSANAPTVSEAGFEGPVSPSTKITGGLRYDQIHDPNWTLGVELQKYFAKFKGEMADGSLNRTVEISFVNLFNSARGITTSGELPRDFIVKVDTARFYNTFVTAVKQNGGALYGMGSREVKGLMLKFDPPLIVAAIRNDRSLLAVRQAVSAVQQALAEQYPKGVRISYSEGLLEEMLRTAGGDGSGLARLAASLNTESSDSERSRLIAAYIEPLKSGYLTARSRAAPREMSLISLRSLVTRAGEYRDRWADLPAEIRRPGGIGRIVGYRLEADDVILIGEPAGPDFQLSLDEIIEGVRAAYVRDSVPFCSLDPDPADLAGIQTVRVGGVAVDSIFARTMLDADYLMKRIGAGTAAVDTPGFRPLPEILRRHLAENGSFESMSRLWFSPAPLRPGDIELSSDGRFVLFSGAMQVLSEQMVNSQEGLVGTGASDPVAGEFAAGFTAFLPEIERKFPDIGRLHGLFDVVLMSRIWRRLDVRSPWIDRLADLPAATRPKGVYRGITARIRLEEPAGEMSFTGGVRLRTAAGSRSMMVAGTGQAGALERGTVPGGSVASRAATDGVMLPNARAGVSTLDASIVGRMTARREFDRAAREIERLRSARPFDPEVWCLDAQNLFQKGRFVSAISAAERALELEPDDPHFRAWALIVTFQAHFMLGENEEALAAIDRLIISVPDSYRARLARADALAAADRSADAREEYRAAQRLYPNSYEVYVRFGVFEVSQGFIPTGKSLLERAKRFAATDAERASTRSGLALAEIGMAILGDVETRLRTGGQLAASVIADPASDPLALVRARTALAEIALINGDVAAAENSVAEAQRIAPMSPFLYIALAEWGLANGKTDLAEKYLTLAERIAPNLPAVRKLRGAVRGK